jgi:transposase-like protein
MEKLTTELVMDERKRDRRGRRLTAAIGREELLRGYEQSGLTQAEFARREGIKYPTFASWVQAKRRATAATVGVTTPTVRPAGRVRFAEVPMSALVDRAANDALSVTLPGGLVVRGSDATLIAALVKALNA